MKKKQKGFTLIELLLTIFAVCGMFAIFTLIGVAWHFIAKTW